MHINVTWLYINILLILSYYPLGMVTNMGNFIFLRHFLNAATQFLGKNEPHNYFINEGSFS